jgi:hypothetical protein
MSKISETIRKMNGRIQANQNNDRFFRKKILKQIDIMFWCMILLSVAMILVALAVAG